MITYVYRLLYKNLIVTTNQKSIIDIHTKKKKQSKHITKDSHQITREQKKEKKKPDLQNNPQTMNKMAIKTYYQ